MPAKEAKGIVKPAGSQKSPVFEPGIGRGLGTPRHQENGSRAPARWAGRQPDGTICVEPMEGPRPDLFASRRAGVLLHLTSLPGPFDYGVLGPDTHKFVDFLSEAGFSIWQTLPIGAVSGTTLSPYALCSANAGNHRLLTLDLPETTPWRLTGTELGEGRCWSTRRWLLDRLWHRFRRGASDEDRQALEAFVRRERHWLVPFALFEALKAAHEGRPWWEWPESLRRREPEAVASARNLHRDRVHQTMFEQYLFDQQWRELKLYANTRGVYLFGDLPVYANLDSVDVWWKRELFQVDDLGAAAVVSGVPPDYFSADGQLWGHPIYDWERMRADGYVWWVKRIRRQLERFDLLRIDHFRAFESYWEVPGDAPTARTGRWMGGPGDALLEALAQDSQLGGLVAEDLGMITPQVRELRDRFHLPGMLVLQFAFDGSADNPFLPQNHVRNAVVYTGTHDNDTTVGWYRSLEPGTRRRVDAALAPDPAPMPDALIEAALSSPAQLAILPMQDLLGLGSEDRMNTPGTTDGNWTWRFDWRDLPGDLAGRCLGRLQASGRLQ